MKVLQVTPDWFPKVAGCAVASYNLSQYLIKNGHETTILTCDRKDLDKKGMDVRTVPVLFNLLGLHPFVYNLRPTLEKLQKDYDVIIIHSYMYEINARVALFRKLGIIKKPVVLFFHGGLDPNMTSYLGLPVRIFKKIYDSLWGASCFKYSDHIITLSEPDGELIKRKYKVPAEKITYINNGTDISRFYRKKEDDIKRVIFIGRLVKWKGVEFFPRIIKSIPKDVEMIIVGGGPMEPEILELSKKYPNIKYIGDVNYMEIPKLLAKSDILILPSFTEAAPNTLIEASAAGIASIAFSVGDIPNLLPKENGYVIEPYDIEDFCGKINLLLKEDELRDEMGKNARKHAEENLDYGKLVKKISKTLVSTIK